MGTTFKTSFSDILRNMHFLCATENSPQEAVGEDWSQIWWRCDEIRIIVNLGQKYEGDLGSYDFLFCFKPYNFTIL